jgi:hypothetical protein
MTDQWNSKCWNAGRQRLCRAVFTATKKESAYAPMNRPLSIGNYLVRSFDRKYLNKATPDLIHLSSALEAIRVRDAAEDRNRFTGFVPAFGGQTRIQSTRGGLYCSEDVKALMAENYRLQTPIYRETSRTKHGMTPSFPSALLHYMSCTISMWST